jgi:hypothetical protein
METSDDVNNIVRSLICYVRGHGITYESSEFSMNKGNLIREVFNTHVTWTNPRRRLYVSPFAQQPFRVGLATARVFYMLSGSNYLDPIKFYSASVARFSDDGITIPGSSYGNRIFGLDGTGGQFEAVAQLISSRPDTKRGEIVIYWPHDAGRQSNDIPCVSNIVFMPRGGTLHMTMQMRANDVAKLLPYNLFEFSILMECMAAQTGLALGALHHTSVSLHLRGQDIEHVADVSECATSASMSAITTFSNSLRLQLREVEHQIRTEISQVGVKLGWSWYQGMAGTFEYMWQDLIGVLLMEALRCRQTCTEDLLWLQRRMLETLPCSDAVSAYYL